MRLSAEDAFGKYGDRVFAAAFNVCRCREDADDVVQDTFIRYLSQDRDFGSEEHIKAWLIRTAVNRAKDLAGTYWRKHRSTWEDYMDELVFTEPEDERLFASVMDLPDRYRLAIHLFYYEDYSIREIADILGVREGTVKARLSRGRALLKKTLKEEWNDDE